MKKIIVAICLMAFTVGITSCGASRRGTGCPNSWDGYKYKG